MATMRDLPPELLLQIFQHLEVSDLCYVAGVCRYWNYVSRTEALWRELCRTLEVNSETIQSDHLQGYSWKEVSQMNYGNRAKRRQWLAGRHSKYASYGELPDKLMCTMDVEGWGEIFQMELER